MDAQASAPVVVPELTPPPPLPVPVPQTPRRKLKPDGLPSMSAMIVTALQAAGKAEKPATIVAYIRNRW
jgi:hypothetical protein